MEPRLKVAICGAGIGGLITSVALSSSPDIEVDIYEGAKKLGEAGAGIGILPRQWTILEELGVAVDLVDCTEPPSSRNFIQRKSDQAKGQTFLEFPPDAWNKGFHRGLFQAAILRHVSPSHRIHCSKRLRSYKQVKDQILLEFEDGTTAFCDLLIGADGIKSAVRRTFVQLEAARAEAQGRKKDAQYLLTCADPVFSGMIVYRNLTSVDRLRSFCGEHKSLEGPTQYLGDGLIVNVFPVAGGKLVSCGISIVRNDHEGTPFDGNFIQNGCPLNLEELFRGWEPDVKGLIACFENPSQWAVHTVRPLPTFVSDGVLLLGDAAHAMNPHQGAGACQAIEDAFILSKLLAHPKTTKETLKDIIKIYDDIRRPFALDIQARSRLNAQYLSFTAPGCEAFRFFPRCGTDDAETTRGLEALGKKIQDNWKWAWTTSIDEDVKRALFRIESI